MAHFYNKDPTRDPISENDPYTVWVHGALGISDDLQRAAEIYRATETPTRRGAHLKAPNGPIIGCLGFG